MQEKATKVAEARDSHLWPMVDTYVRYRQYRFTEVRGAESREWRVAVSGNNRVRRIHIKHLPLPKYLWSTVKNTSRAERLSCVVAIIALIFFVCLIVYFSKLSTATEPVVEDVSTDVWHVSREMWYAEQHHTNDTTEPFAPLKLVIIQHTVSNECHTMSSCSAELRNLQRYFLSMGYDIPYNYLVGNDGRVYEGRGWNKVGAHTIPYNRCSVGVGFIGDYRGELPVHTQVTQAQLDNIQLVFQEGVRLGHLDPNFYVVGAQDVSNTVSPGSNLLAAIREWDFYDHENQFRGRTCEEIYGHV